MILGNQHIPLLWSSTVLWRIFFFSEIAFHYISTKLLSQRKSPLITIHWHAFTENNCHFAKKKYRLFHDEWLDQSKLSPFTNQNFFIVHNGNILSSLGIESKNFKEKYLCFYCKFIFQKIYRENCSVSKWMNILQLFLGNI